MWVGEGEVVKGARGVYGGVRGRGGRLLLDQHLLLLLEQGELAEHLLLRDAAHEARHLEG